MNPRYRASELLRFLLRPHVFAVIATIAVLSAAAVTGLRGQGGRRAVLRAAYAVPDGGGCCPLSDTGVRHDIIFKGVNVLAKSKTGGAYCSGFTFEVVIAAALERGLLDDIEPYQIAQFQREWYGVPKHARVRQALVALENLGIGSEVSQNGARAGDFIIFSRWDGTGHSAIFLEWQWKDGRRVGFRYRSAQSETLGVGDRIEYFDDSGFPEGNVIPMYFFVGRLK